MKRWAQEGKINRKVLKVLEERFCSSKIKPQQDQMMEWANELKITFEDVKDWFQMMWEGKLEYEWLKSVQKEESGTNNLGTFSQGLFQGAAFPYVFKSNSFFTYLLSFILRYVSR